MPVPVIRSRIANSFRLSRYIIAAIFFDVDTDYTIRLRRYPLSSFEMAGYPTVPTGAKQRQLYTAVLLLALCHDAPRIRHRHGALSS